jgi:hypothetical protein
MGSKRRTRGSQRKQCGVSYETAILERDFPRSQIRCVYDVLYHVSVGNRQGRRRLARKVGKADDINVT